MFKKLIYVFSFVLVLSLVSTVSAVDADVTIRSFDAPVIDGIVDDVWSSSTEQPVDVTMDGTISGASDCSGSWWVLWDSDYLYVLVDVTDESLVADTSIADSWQDDSVEVYIDGDNSKGATTDDNDFQYRFRWNTEVEDASEYFHPPDSLEGVEYAVATTDNGYLMEIKLPWANMTGETPQGGQVIGIDIFINDDDDGDGRDAQISWHATEGIGWTTPSMWGTGLIVAGNNASNPKPPNRSMYAETWATLNWLAGVTAVSHDVYIGDNFDDVNDATRDSDIYKGNQGLGSLYFLVGFQGCPYPEGLVPGMTYYWRVDEIAADETVYKGSVWSFTVPPHTAYNPIPAKGAESVVLGVTLNWTGGFGAKLHTVYFGEDYDTVANAADGSSQGIATYTPGPLKFAKTYYWRVDEDDGDAFYKGEVWSFTTEGAVAGPNPADGAEEVKPSVVLTWDAGAVAASHEVYFGEDADAVKNATKTSPEYKGPKALGEESYDPGKLTFNTNYYWRIDEVNGVNPDSPWAGNVWSFTTGDFFVIDDFEDYDTGENQIWYSWHDGLGYGSPGTPDYYPGNGTGAAVGDETTPSYTEETIVHGGNQSMPVAYDNNKQGFSKYSEVDYTLTDQRDWTEQGVGELSLWFRGYPAYVGSFVEGPLGTFTMTASGADIWAVNSIEADEFHFAYKVLTGPGSIVAKVESIDNTNAWAKAGVMIRETLNPDSAHVMMAVTPASGVSFQRRPGTGGTSVDTTSSGITAPYWVKIERDLTGNFTAYRSANGSTWETQGTENIPMSSNVYIGLALTSHDAALTCEAVFSNVTTTGTVGPQWAHQDIGIASNDAEPLYVAVSNSAGTPAVVTYDDPAATQIDTWTQWIIPLQDIADQGINLANVDRIAIGIGIRGNMTITGGSGKMFFDDIRLYQPRTAAEE